MGGAAGDARPGGQVAQSSLFEQAAASPAQRRPVQRPRPNAAGLAFVLAALALCPPPSARAGEPEWQPAADRNGVQVLRRAGAGGVDALRATGRFAYPARAVRDVLMDVGRYGEFMPYTKEARLLDSGPGRRLAYLRVASPLVSDRDYVIDLACTALAGEAGYRLAWSVPGDEAGVAPVAGVVRVRVNHGYWELRPDGPDATRAQYFLQTDPGGRLPAFVANMANTEAIPRVFAAVAERAALPRYADPDESACVPAREIGR